MAFTGGEPTVRSDLPELVEKAAQLGFTEIGITTNGRMLACTELTHELLEAGLNRISFSIHSANPALHDALTGIAGSFDQLRQGIETAAEIAEKRGTDLILHSVSLLLPDTVGNLDETIACAASMGAAIHIVQPFIASRENLHVAADYFVDYPTMAAAIAMAGKAAAAGGTRVKPYNIPYCILQSLEGIETQQYDLRTYKRQENAAQQDRAFRQAQFFEVKRCSTCPTPCPGFRVEHYPEDRMAAEIVEDAAEYRSPRLLLPGLDLLPADGLRAALQELQSPDREITVLTGGNMWCSHDRFGATLEELGIEEVVHLLRTGWEGSRSGEPEPGNEDVLLHLSRNLQRRGLKNRLLVSLLDLPSFAFPFDTVAAHFDEFLVAVPRFWRGLKGEQELETRLEEVGLKALNCAESLKNVLPVRVATFDSVRILSRTAALWQKTFSSRFHSEDWSGSLVRHRFASPAYNFVMWSYPFWLF